MAKRVTQLTELTTPATDDYLVVVDTSAGTTKKITYQNLVNIPELGWTSAGETWAYASATTFTVAGVNVTEKYPVGTKIRLKQGGSYKYFYVVATSFSTNTTITVYAGSDYSLANSAITDNYFSYAEVATGFPHWFNYTPTWTADAGSPTIGNGTLTGKFMLNGKLCTFRIKFVAGSTTTFGTSSWKLGFPITAFDISANRGFSLAGYAEDNSVSGYAINHGVMNTTNLMYLRYQTGTNGASSTIGATTPFTWANTDFFDVSGYYEIA